MTPYDYQEDLARKAHAILAKHFIVYFACEERTGKTLAAIRTAELIPAKQVLVITKKKAMEGWQDTLKAYRPKTVKFVITSYSQAHKVEVNLSYDLIILDESHNYISAFPKPSKTWLTLAKLTAALPIIYISATPHAQTYSMLYHQFALSWWSPFRNWTKFLSWHKKFGVEKTIWLAGRKVKQYNETKDELVKEYTDHLFLTKTRAELDFVEPSDKLHFIELGEKTKVVYNYILKEKALELNGHLILYDTPMKLRTALHMLEGGTAKADEVRLVLGNSEKIDYIKARWGDLSSLVVMYQYIAEKQKLGEAFKNVKILQATSFAEGIDLSMYDDLVIYSQDFSTARHSQRRARQANINRKKPIVVHFILVKGGISEQVYEVVSKNKENFIDSRFLREELL